MRFSVEYPDRRLNRLTSAFRIFTVIPIAIVFATIGGHNGRWGARTSSSIFRMWHPARENEPADALVRAALALMKVVCAAG